MGMKCHLCGPQSPAQYTVGVYGYHVCPDCLLSLIENEVERRGERADAKWFSDYHGDTPGRPLTDLEVREEMARIQRDLK